MLKIEPLEVYTTEEHQWVLFRSSWIQNWTAKGGFTPKQIQFETHKVQIPPKEVQFGIAPLGKW